MGKEITDDIHNNSTHIIDIDWRWIIFHEIKRDRVLGNNDNSLACLEQYYGVCPLCGKPLKYDGYECYETLCEHVSDPNNDNTPFKPTFVCSNETCRAYGKGYWMFYAYDGEWIGYCKDDPKLIGERLRYDYENRIPRMKKAWGNRWYELTKYDKNGIYKGENFRYHILHRWDQIILGRNIINTCYRQILRMRVKWEHRHDVKTIANAEV
jgi:hypothetical protein